MCDICSQQVTRVAKCNLTLKQLTVLSYAYFMMLQICIQTHLPESLMQTHETGFFPTNTLWRLFESMVHSRSYLIRHRFRAKFISYTMPVIESVINRYYVY